MQVKHTVFSLLAGMFGLFLTGMFAVLAFVAGFTCRGLLALVGRFSLVGMDQLWYEAIPRVWSRIVHRYVAMPFLGWRRIIVADFPPLLPNERAVFFGPHFSDLALASGVDAIFEVSGNRNLVVLGKIELLRPFLRTFPFVNPAFVIGAGAWGVRCGIFLDRKGGEKALASISAGIESLPPQSTILIFPEGTRFTPAKLRTQKGPDGALTLRYNKGGLFRICSICPPESTPTRYFRYRWACSKPDHRTFRHLFSVHGAMLSLDVEEVTDRLPQTEEAIAQWLNEERFAASDFIGACRHNTDTCLPFV
ncbi:MAG: hypothetical protein O2877_01565 [bacterium]|nr:hypothetical protein [bacterium]